MTVRRFRSHFATWSILGLVTASLVAFAPAANANGTSGPVGPTDFSYNRESTDGFSFVVKPNETAGLQSSTYVDETWSGWPLPRNTVLSRNAFKVTTLPADVEQYEWDYRNWELSNWQDENCESVFEDTPTIKVTTDSACARTLWVSDTITVENNSMSNKTIVTNAADLRVKYGKKTIGASSAKTDSAYANISISGVESAVITSSEDFVGLGFSICLAEETLSPEDELTIHPVVTLDGSDTTFTISDWNEELTGEEDPDSEVTYTVPTPEEGEDLENLTVQLGLYADETVAGTYAGSVDVKLDGTSVTEPCPTYEPDWPTLEIVSMPDYPDGEIQSDSVPTDTFTDNDNFDQYSYHADGFGGMFYWGYPGADWEDNENSEVNVVHMQGGSPTNNLAGAGEIIVTTGEYGYFDIARFGEDGQKWFTLVEGNKGAYKFAAGTMTSNAGAETRNLTSKALNALCGTGFVSEYVAAVSAPTVNPLLQVSCGKGAIKKSVLAKIVAGKVSVVTTLGTGTSSRPCVVPSFGTDTRASGSEAAVVFYTRVSSKDADGYCGSFETTTSSRSITTVTAALVASRVTVASSPWTGHDEPAFIDIAAGATSGTWFGVTNEMTDTYSPHTPTQLFTMTGSAITIESEITLDDSVDFGDWSLVTPLSRGIGSSGWKLMIAGTAEVDGENVGRATVANIDPDTGEITNGDILEATEMGYFSGRIIGRFSSDSDGNATFYTVTDEDTYTSTVWSTPDR